MNTSSLGLRTLCAASLLLAAACNPYSDYCEQAVDCLDGNDLDIDACEASLGGYSDTASAYECSDDFDAYFECLNDRSSCKSTNGTDYWTDDGDCNDESDDLAHCMSDASDSNVFGGNDTEVTSTACSELAAVCAGCTDAYTQSACQSVVDFADANTCSAGIDSYAAIC
jgi:hypothetical protein